MYSTKFGFDEISSSYRYAMNYLYREVVFDCIEGVVIYDHTASSVYIYVPYNSCQIDISGCTGFTDEALIHLLEGDLSPGSIYDLDLSHCTQLELGFVGLRRHASSTNCKTLKLRSIPRISDSVMEWIGVGCQHLQYIDISDSAINDYALGYLFKGCKRYVDLFLYFIPSMLSSRIINYPSI